MLATAATVLSQQDIANFTNPLAQSGVDYNNRDWDHMESYFHKDTFMLTSIGSDITKPIRKSCGIMKFFKTVFTKLAVNCTLVPRTKWATSTAMHTVTDFRCASAGGDPTDQSITGQTYDRWELCDNREWKITTSIWPFGDAGSAAKPVFELDGPSKPQLELDGVRRFFENIRTQRYINRYNDAFNNQRYKEIPSFYDDNAFMLTGVDGVPMAGIDAITQFTSNPEVVAKYSLCQISTVNKFRACGVTHALLAVVCPVSEVMSAKMIAYKRIEKIGKKYTATCSIWPVGPNRLMSKGKAWSTTE